MAQKYQPLQDSRPREQSPATLRQAPHRNAWNKIYDDGWALEIASCILGIVLVTVLVVVLHNYDGRSVPEFGSVFNKHVTLNTVVSILLGFAIPAFLLPVGESISQLKWIWYAKGDRPLDGFESFDKASRGPLGGALFLFSLQKRPLAAFGALLMVLQLAISPLAQSALIYPTRPVIAPDASGAVVQVARQWEGGGQNLVNYRQNNSELYYAISTSDKGAILNGLFNQNGTLEPMQPFCGNGNCTFGSYSTLSLCSSIANVTSSLVRSNVSITGDIRVKSADRFSLPGGHYLQMDAMDGWELNFTSVGNNIGVISRTGQSIPMNYSDSVAFKNQTNITVADVFYIFVEQGKTGGIDQFVQAVELSLRWCVRTYKTDVVNGKASTTQVSVSDNFSAQPGYYLTYRPPGSPKNNSTGDFLVDANTHYTMQQYFANLLTGNGTLPMGGGRVGGYVSSDAAGAMWEPFFNVGTLSPSQRSKYNGTLAMQTVLDNIATSFTNHMRTGPSSAESRPSITGTMTVHTPYVQVQWQYVYPTIAFAILSVLFFTTTLVVQRTSTNRTRTWKSSSLPLLRALGADMQTFMGGAHGGGMQDMSALRRQTAATRVHLEVLPGEGWRLTNTRSIVS